MRGTARVKERPLVSYIDLPVFGVPMRLAWKKHRMRCPNPVCAKKTWSLEDHRIAAKKCLLTTRAAKWATVQVGTRRRSRGGDELACDWHTVNDAVTTYGKALLVADSKRLNKTSAIGLDETNFVQLAPTAHADYATTVCDVEHHQIIDILPSPQLRRRRRLDGRTAPGLEAADQLRRLGHVRHLRRGLFGRLAESPPRWSIPSMRSPSPTAASTPCGGGSRPSKPATGAARRPALPRAAGAAARRGAPDEEARPSVCGRCSSSAIRSGEVAIAYRMKERLRDFYQTTDPDEARQMLDELQGHCLKKAMPPEVQKLGRTIRKWFDKLCNYHLARVSNGPTEALNNLDQTDQAHRLRVQELRELPDPGAPLRRQAELASAGLDRRPMTRLTPPESEEPK